MHQHTPFQPLLPKQAGEHLNWGQLYGSSYGLIIAAAAEIATGPLVVITADTPTAQRLDYELRFYLPKDGSIPMLNFPDHETLPYDAFSPHQDIISERLFTLHQMPSLQRGILIVPIATLMHRLCPRDYLDANSLIVRTGDILKIEQTRRRFENCGYRCVSQVMEHGEFAVRGGIIDLYPMGSNLPYRIDLLDDEVDTIRTFDPETQRSIKQVDNIRLLPAREFPLDEDSVDFFRQAYRAMFSGDPQKSVIYRGVSNMQAPPGIEYYLPLFFESTQTLADYLPASSLLISTEGILDNAAAFWEESQRRYELRKHDPERPVVEPGKIFIDPESISSLLEQFPRVSLNRVKVTHIDSSSYDSPIPDTSGHTLHSYDYATSAPPTLALDSRSDKPAAALSQYIQSFAGKILIAAETTGRRETLLELLRNQQINPTPVEDWHAFLAGDQRLAITVASLDNGVVIDVPAISVIAEPQLFGDQAQQRRRRKKKARDTDAIVQNLTELNIGAPVVHEDHGVGRYLGLNTLTIDNLEAEFLTLEYAGGDKLYVPVSSLQLISRYTGAAPEKAPLHKLGGDQWAKARKRASERVRDVAAELLDLYAKREASKGHAFVATDDQYAAFCAAFPFEETPDQQQAIDEVIEDMMKDRPMDRLVCGDVGFGKTEVAMRAAFVATFNNYQVAVLVPTTLLCQQHFQNFRDRFADLPIRIEMLSRFRTKKQQEETLTAIANGKVDIVIGTHKLLQANLEFKNLGLVILDEEHRFGVRQKEKLKALRTEVDVLTLTATPIPRTLNLALSGLRGMSAIMTPPTQRLAIKTFVREWDNTSIREACLREIMRGGQVYFVHNEVRSIEKIANQVRALLPDAKVEIAHGQMSERELEQVMLDFYHQRFNILVCTTIIESGIDLPNANTIIINNADHFGLAQLHQLRGRVGRSHHRAYAYLITPPRRQMTADAIKRLEAIESLGELGAGFTLATHDLEIRGAGELLGDEQSGQIHEVGFTLYMELLERAVNALKSGEEPALLESFHHGPEIDLKLPALIPADYLPDVHTRLVMYKRISNARDDEELRDLQVEMIDRFGLLTPEIKSLFRISKLKLAANILGIRKLDAGPSGGRILFDKEPNVDAGIIIQLIQTQPANYKFDGQDKLRFIMNLEDREERFKAVEGLLDLLAGQA